MDQHRASQESDTVSAEQSIDRIDDILPQTQCTKCGYPACRRYAEAIARGEADINQCPPGGAAGIIKLAALLHRAPKPLNPANGTEKPRHVALIDEALCIGCTLCIQACPVDAIIGGPKFMHTVLTTLCSGCDLCVAPCPVDCITMVPATGDDQRWDGARASAARQRFEQRATRLHAEGESHARSLAEKRQHIAPEDDRKRALIQAAMERARLQRAASTKTNSADSAAKCAPEGEKTGP